ncbi:hypothetical protein QJS10_CPB14g01632 [Acorus calamus]|uniref:Uncharacterized protein n=1 Tax=Acorus calamus TaxID=4465 RepID=A0AAV9DC79_ACOCL|nr:hypothetical protein QJS10_CPB14g01632 [Acorus calamus]
MQLIFLVSVSLLFLFFFSNTPFHPQHITAIFNHCDSSSPTNLAHILFNIGASTATWANRRRFVELWWQPNRTRGFVWLDKDLPPSPPDISTHHHHPPCRVSADASRFPYTNPYGSRDVVRIARIVSEAYRAGPEDVRWFVMGDDDTVFFPENLVSVLGRHDWEEMKYIGGISESVEQNVVTSYEMGFGGGGFAVSRPLAAELAGAMDGCLYRYAGMYCGDMRVQACVGEIGVTLSRELGFHQMDIRGDPYGLLAAHPVAPLVSLHHFDTMNLIDPRKPTQIDSLKTLISASRVDPGRTLQQSVCYETTKNWSVSVSWGYTVQLYPWIVHARDLFMPIQTFKTFGTHRNGPFTFNTRPPGKGPCERPLVYMFDEVGETGSGSVSTRYSRVQTGPECERGDSGFGEASMVEGVQVFSHKMAPDEWRKAQRRYCCEARMVEEDHHMRITIRKCRRGESASPPT